jgi:tetratricopeptide (TPR) repeat protein
MTPMPWTRATLAGLALLGMAVSAAAQSPLQPSSQMGGKPSAQGLHDVARGYLRTGAAHACKGDLALLRYPYEAGYRRARNAAQSDAQDAPANGRRQALLQAIAQLPVRQVRPGGERGAAPDEARAANARQAARASFTSAIAVLEKLVAADPGQLAWQRDLAVAYGRLAAVSGHWKAARDLHQKAVDLQKDVVAKDPANTAWQRDLANLYQGLGDVQFGMGGEKPARAAKVAELDLREKLVEDAPSDTSLQHELALNYDRLGEMFHTIVNVSQARAAYLAGFEIHEKLVQHDPGNAQWQRDLARNRTGAGAFESNKGNEKAGPALLQEALRLRTALVARDPANVDDQVDLRSTYLLIAEDHLSGVKTEEALAVYRSALQHMQRLAASHAADPGWLYYQLEFQFYLGNLIQDETRPRLGTRVAPPREQVERVTAQTREVFQSMLTTSRALVAMSGAPETTRIYETAQAPRLCTNAL